MEDDDGAEVLCLQVSTSQRGYRTAVAFQRLDRRPFLAYLGKGESVRKRDMGSIFGTCDLSQGDYRKYLRWGPFNRRIMDGLLGQKSANMVVGNLVSLFPQGLKSILKKLRREHDFSLVHVLGYPDGPVIPVREVFDCPVIFDFRDLSTGLSIETLKGNYRRPVLQKLGLDARLAGWQLRRWERFEKAAIDLPDGIVFYSEEMRQYLKEKHGWPGSKKTLVFENRPFADEVPKEALERDSAKDGIPRIVYIGALSTEGYRDNLELFRVIARSGFHLHIYTDPSVQAFSKYKDGLKEIPKAHMHSSMPPEELFREMTRYDYGIVPFRPEGDIAHLDLAIPNKFFEYLACGLRVISTPLRSMSRLIRENGCGFTYTSGEDLIAGLREDWKEREGHELDRALFTQEARFDEVRGFYGNFLH